MMARHGGQEAARDALAVVEVEKGKKDNGR